MFLATDGEDGSGLQVEKVGPTFSSSRILSSKTRKKLAMFCSSYENSLDTFLLVS